MVHHWVEVIAILGLGSLSTFLFYKPPVGGGVGGRPGLLPPSFGPNIGDDRVRISVSFYCEKLKNGGSCNVYKHMYRENNFVESNLYGRINTFLIFAPMIVDRTRTTSVEFHDTIEDSLAGHEPGPQWSMVMRALDMVYS